MKTIDDDSIFSVDSPIEKGDEVEIQTVTGKKTGKIISLSSFFGSDGSVSSRVILNNGFYSDFETAKGFIKKYFDTFGCTENKIFGKTRVIEFL